MLFKKQTKTQKRIANKFLNNVALGLISIAPVPHLSFPPVPKVTEIDLTLNNADPGLIGFSPISHLSFSYVPTDHRNRFNPHCFACLGSFKARDVTPA